jgi:hypothetical protein
MPKYCKTILLWQCSVSTWVSWFCSHYFLYYKFMHLLNTVVSVQQQSSLCTVLNTLHIQRFCDFHNGAPDQTDGIKVFSQFVTLEQFYPCHDLGDFPNLTWSPSFLCMIWRTIWQKICTRWGHTLQCPRSVTNWSKRRLK